MVSYKSIMGSIDSGKAKVPDVANGRFCLDEYDEYPVRLLLDSMDPDGRAAFEQEYHKEKETESHLKLAPRFRSMKTRMGVELITGEKAMELLPAAYTATAPDIVQLYAAATKERVPGSKSAASVAAAEAPAALREPDPVFDGGPDLEEIIAPAEPAPTGTLTFYEGREYSPAQVLGMLEGVIEAPVLMRRVKESIHHGMKTILRSETYIPQDTHGVVAPAKQWYDFLQHQLPGAYAKAVLYEQEDGFISMEQAYDIFMQHSGQAAFDIFTETLEESSSFLLRDRMVRKSQVVRDSMVLRELVEENARI